MKKILVAILATALMAAPAMAANGGGGKKKAKKKAKIECKKDKNCDPKCCSTKCCDMQGQQCNPAPNCPAS